MLKAIDSVRLFRLAKKRSENITLPIDSFQEIENECAEGRAMFLGFLFCEYLYQNNKITKEVKDFEENRIEADFQKLALSRMDVEKIYTQNLTRLQNTMLKGEWEDAVQYAINCMECGHPPTIDLKGLFEHSKRKFHQKENKNE